MKVSLLTSCSCPSGTDSVLCQLSSFTFLNACLRQQRVSSIFFFGGYAAKKEYTLSLFGRVSAGSKYKRTCLTEYSACGSVELVFSLIGYFRSASGKQPMRL